MHLISVIEFLKNTDELEQARQLLLTFSKYATTVQQYDELGMLFEKVKAYPESLDMLKKCLDQSTPDLKPAIYANLAKVYNHVNDPINSLRYSNLILQQSPNDSEALMEQSFSRYLNGEFEESNRIQERLLMDPITSQSVKDRIVFNMGTFELAKGNFKRGLYNMIVGGKKIGIWPQHNKPFQMWDGSHTDKTILVFAEAGIGDEIINIRFMNTLKQRGLKAFWVGSRPDTTELFKTNGFDCITKEQINPLENYVYCESMSLPVLLGVDQTELWNEPYIHAKPDLIEKWKAQLPEKFVTIKWSGNPYYDQDLHRSVDKELLIESMQKYNLPIVSLQVDDAQPDSRLITPNIVSWDDTIAIQHLATLNITSCTSTAHSAGASGANCVVLPPIATYFPWVYLKEDNSSYWYGTNLKVFPQKKHRVWEETINLATQHLETLV